MGRTLLKSGYTTTLIVIMTVEIVAQKPPEKLPQFNFYGFESEDVTDTWFRNDRPLIIFYFDPTCSHCEVQAQWVTEELGALAGIDLLWIAWEENEALAEFKVKYFPSVENVYFGQDLDAKFDGIFGFSEIPTVFVYNAQNQLLKKFNNETKPRRLLKELNR
ncbi:MAG: hypothetical protein RJQ09_14205 [Cyclobacteriaceae bacterium]